MPITDLALTILQPDTRSKRPLNLLIMSTKVLTLFIELILIVFVINGNASKTFNAKINIILLVTLLINTYVSTLKEKIKKKFFIGSCNYLNIFFPPVYYKIKSFIWRKMEGKLRAMLREEDCIGVPASEEYKEYLIDYMTEEPFFEKDLSNYCVFPIGFNQSIVYMRSDESLTGRGRNFRYNIIPKCYGLMASEELEETGVLRVRRSPQLGYRGGGTLIGVIDTGISLEDPLFLYEDGTSKVAALWDQGDQRGNRPEGFLYGTEWTNGAINEALRNAPETLPNDENGHGTFLCKIAAGRETEAFSGVAPDAELVIVKLKQAKQYLREFYSIEKDIWACQEDDVMLAVRYIINVANRLERPVSICLGIGTNLGGHNGANGLERYLSYLSLLPRISFHVAAGNEGISGHHYHGVIPRGEEYETVDFNVAEGENGFVMELWGDEPNVFSVGLISPGGENIDRIQLKLNETRTISFFPEDTVLEIRSFPGAAIGGSQVIRMNFHNLVPGIWKLFVYGTGNGEKPYDIWMPISNFLKEETVFLNPESEKTVTSPGNAQFAIAYAPYDVKTGSLYVRASKGFTRDGRIVPDLSAPGVAVSVPGRNRREQVMSGSSVAAAFGVGIGALLQEWAFVDGYDTFMNGQNLRTYLIQGAEKTGPYEYPNREWGYGKVNAYDTFLVMRG